MPYYLIQNYHGLVWLNVVYDFCNFIIFIKEKGITPLVSTSASEWLKVNIYPTRHGKNMERDQRSKKSIGEFVIPYLQRLAFEFFTHTEYNAYKHGLHCFPAIGTLQAFGDDTGL